jgi:hypothetical protein
MHYGASGWIRKKFKPPKHRRASWLRRPQREYLVEGTVNDLQRWLVRHGFDPFDRAVYQAAAWGSDDEIPEDWEPAEEGAIFPPGWRVIFGQQER